MSQMISEASSASIQSYNRIKVMVRVRPFLEEEIKNEEQAISSNIKIKD